MANGYTGTEAEWLASLGTDDRAYTDAGDAATLDAANAHADAGDAATLDAANAHADAGDAATLDAANAHADAGDAATLDAANAHADAGDAATLASANRYTDARFAGLDDRFRALDERLDRSVGQLNQRIDRAGAMSAAMMSMATSTAGVRSDDRLGVGVGFQGGERAVAIGYQRAFSGRATLTIGGSFSGDDRSAGVGVGFGW